VPMTILHHFSSQFSKRSLCWKFASQPCGTLLDT